MTTGNREQIKGNKSRSARARREKREEKAELVALDTIQRALGSWDFTDANLPRLFAKYGTLEMLISVDSAIDALERIGWLIFDHFDVLGTVGRTDLSWFAEAESDEAAEQGRRFVKAVLALRPDWGSIDSTEPCDEALRAECRTAD